MDKSWHFEIVDANTTQFLGFESEIHDVSEENPSVCLRYRSKGVFSLDVSEWFNGEGRSIDEIVSSYHLGDVAICSCVTDGG